MGAFANRVFAVVRRIPQWRVATYGQVARMIGASRSARYVGYALHNNPSPGMGPEDIPCHRVVFKDGSMARSFAFGGPEEQRAMLKSEGVGFGDGGRVVMEEFQWNGCGIDWEAELVEWTLHDCESCDEPRKDCKRTLA